MRQLWLSTIGVGLMLIGTSDAKAAKVETWRQESASAFNKGKKERVVISDSGRVRLGQTVSSDHSLTVARVWDLAPRFNRTDLCRDRR